MNKLYGIVFFVLYGVLTAAQEPRILIIDPWNNDMPCGLNMSHFAQAKEFKKHQTFFCLLCWRGSYTHSLFKAHGLPYETFPAQPQLGLEQELFYSDPLYTKQTIAELCKKNAINVIVSMRWQDLALLHEVGESVGAKVIFYRVATVQEDGLDNHVRSIKGADGFIGTQAIVDFLKEMNSMHDLGISHFAAVTPFWDDSRCVPHSPVRAQYQYFRRKFKIRIDDAPVACVLANLHNPCKNHQLLLNAVAILKTMNKPIHVMVAGSGPLQSELEKLAHDLLISQYIHFLGSTEDIAGVLHHSDMHILPSYYENFPLANLEAAYAKKAIITTGGISSSAFIIDNETGLLFENNNAADLARKIEYLIDQPQERERLGINGYYRLMNCYANTVLYSQWIQVLQALLA